MLRSLAKAVNPGLDSATPALGCGEFRPRWGNGERAGGDSDEYAADVESYADSYGLAPEEAARRMCLQVVSNNSAGPDVVRALKRLARDRFVVALPVHEPEFGLLVSFTGGAVPAGARAIVDKAPLPVIVRAGAPYGERDIMRFRDEIDAVLRDHPS